MLIVGRTLADWRASRANLSGISFGIETDSTETMTWPRCISSVAVAESDAASVVPIRVTDTVMVADDDGARIGTVVESIVAEHRGKAIFTNRCVIHRLTGPRVDYESDLGMTTKATIQWDGVASWRAE